MTEVRTSVDTLLQRLFNHYTINELLREVAIKHILFGALKQMSFSLQHRHECAWEYKCREVVDRFNRKKNNDRDLTTRWWSSGRRALGLLSNPSSKAPHYILLCGHVDMGLSYGPFEYPEWGSIRVLHHPFGD